MGEIKRWHFAHTNAGCDEETAYLCGLYEVLCECLKIKPFSLPAFYICFNMPKNLHVRIDLDNLKDYVFCRKEPAKQEEVLKTFSKKRVSFQNAEIIKTGSNQRPEAIKATFENKELYFVITPPDSVCREFSSKPYNGKSTIEINLKNQTKKLDAGRIEDDYALFESPDVSSWLWSNKAEDYIEEINAKICAAEEANIQKERAIEQRKEELEEEERKQQITERAARAEKEFAEYAVLQQIAESIKKGEKLSSPCQIVGNTNGVGNVCPKEKTKVAMVFHNPKCATCQYCAFIKLSSDRDKFRTWCFFPQTINPNRKQNYSITNKIG